METENLEFTCQVSTETMVNVLSELIENATDGDRESCRIFTTVLSEIDDVLMDYMYAGSTWFYVSSSKSYVRLYKSEDCESNPEGFNVDLCNLPDDILCVECSFDDTGHVPQIIIGNGTNVMYHLSITDDDVMVTKMNYIQNKDNDWFDELDDIIDNAIRKC